MFTVDRLLQQTVEPQAGDDFDCDVDTEVGKVALRHLRRPIHNTEILVIEGDQSTRLRGKSFGEDTRMWRRPHLRRPRPLVGERPAPQPVSDLDTGIERQGIQRPRHQQLALGIELPGAQGGVVRVVVAGGNLQRQHG